MLKEEGNDKVRHISAEDVRARRTPPHRLLPGYTVSSVPQQWNWPRNRLAWAREFDMDTALAEILELLKLQTRLSGPETATTVILEGADF
jgi:hypothetical protein